MAQSKKQALRASAGDVVIVDGRKTGDARRLGEVLEVLGEPGREHFRVRWEGGRETILYPSSDTIVKRAVKPRKKKR